MRKEAPAEKGLNPFDGKPRTAPANIRRTTLDGREIPAEAQEETMKVKLNIDYMVCRDGVHPESFKAKEEVDMPVRIASVLLEDGRAALVRETRMEPKPIENKMEPSAPKNKAEKEPAKDKAKVTTAGKTK
jgi:hypothetical protein